MAVPTHVFHIMVLAHFFPYYGTSAFFQSMAKIRAQNHKRKSTSAKLEIVYSRNFLETICWEILGNYMLGNFLETVCWEIRVDTGSFLKG